MNTDKPTSIHEKSQIRKLIATQNVIKKKFKKACKHRLEHENDTSHAMKPLAKINPSASTTLNPTYTEPISLKQSTTHQHDPNEFCDKLRQLINLQIVGDEKRTPEIADIIANLREHGTVL